jgi:type IV pilus assembly protein PilV
MRRRAANGGFSLIEVLVALVIILVALMGIAALQARATIAELEAQQRAMALILLSDIVDRVLANKNTKSCFAYTTDTTNGKPYIGVAGTSDAVLTACTASTAAYNAQADNALADIDDLLEGSSETAAGNKVGGVIGARACISYDTTTELTGKPGTGLFTVVVSWQGMADLLVPAAKCANDQYGGLAKRRAVSQSFRMADLL